MKIRIGKLKKSLAILVSMALIPGVFGAYSFFTDRAVTDVKTTVGTFGMKVTDYSDLDGVYNTLSSSGETRVVIANGRQAAKITTDQATDYSNPSTGIINPGDVGLLEFSIRNNREKSMDTAIVVRVASTVPFKDVDSAEYNIEGLGIPSLSEDGLMLTYPLTVLDTINGAFEKEDGAEEYNKEIFYAYNAVFSKLAGNSYQDAKFTIMVNVYAKQHRKTAGSDWENIGSFEVATSKAAILINGEKFNQKMKQAAGNLDYKNTYSVDNSITAIKMATEMPGDGTTTYEVQSDDSPSKAYIWFKKDDSTLNTGTIYLYSPDGVACSGDISNMFSDLRGLSDISALKDWDISKVTDISYLFYKCYKLTDTSVLSKWNTSSITNMGGIFYDCESLTDISGLTGWDTSKVTNLYFLFSGCKSITNADALSTWKTGNVKFTDSMFTDCSSLSDISGLTNWDMSKVKNMYGMFSGCKSLTDVSCIFGWDTSSLVCKDDMFSNCPAATPSWY